MTMSSITLEQALALPDEEMKVELPVEGAPE